MSEVSKAVAKCLELRCLGHASKVICSLLGVTKKTVDEHFRIGLVQSGCRSHFHLVAEFAAGRIAVVNTTKRRLK